MILIPPNRQLEQRARTLQVQFLFDPRAVRIHRLHVDVQLHRNLSRVQTLARKFEHLQLTFRQ